MKYNQLFFILIISIFLLFTFSLYSISLADVSNPTPQCSDYHGSCVDARSCDTTKGYQAIPNTDCDYTYNGWGICCVPPSNSNTNSNIDESNLNNTTFHFPIQLPTSFDDFFKKIVEILFYLAPIIALFALVYAAYLFITSRGNPKQIEQAKKIITWVIIGLLAVFLSYSIKTLIIKFFTE